MDWEWIITAVLAVVGMVLGGYLKRVKRLLKELAEALKTTVDAIENDVVTREELKKMVKEWKDVLKAVRGKE